MHRFAGAGAYMVTSGTYLKLHHFHGTERLRYLSEYLLRLAADYQWDVQAWAVFPIITILWRWLHHNPDRC